MHQNKYNVKIFIWCCLQICDLVNAVETLCLNNITNSKDEILQLQLITKTAILSKMMIGY